MKEGTTVNHFEEITETNKETNTQEETNIEEITKPAVDDTPDYMKNEALRKKVEAEWVLLIITIFYFFVLYNGVYFFIDELDLDSDARFILLLLDGATLWTLIIVTFIINPILIGIENKKSKDTNRVEEGKKRKPLRAVDYIALVLIIIILIIIGFPLFLSIFG